MISCYFAPVFLQPSALMIAYIEGKLTYRSYDDKDGIKRTVAEIKVEELILLGSK